MPRAWSSTPAPTCVTGKLAAIGTWTRPSATSRAISSRVPGVALAPLVGVIPLIWAPMVVDALVRHAECVDDVRCVGYVKVDRRGHTGWREGTHPVASPSP